MRYLLFLLMLIAFASAIIAQPPETKIKKIKGKPYPGSLIEKAQNGFQFVHPNKVVKFSDLPKNPTYAVGDTLDGGIVYWVDPIYSTDGGVTSRHGKICQFPADIIDTLDFASSNTIDHRAFNKSDGYYNTILIQAHDVDTNAAFRLVLNYPDGGWYIPAVNELEILINADVPWTSAESEYLIGPDQFGDDILYWSSSQRLGFLTAWFVGISYSGPTQNRNIGASILAKEVPASVENTFRLWAIKKF